jgi:hypothetical protein
MSTRMGDLFPSFLASYCPSRVVAARENGDMLVDRYHLDALTGRFEAERTVTRSGRAIVGPHPT